MANNVAYIYEPHYMTQMARVAIDKQQGRQINFIVIECEGKRGVYSWNPNAGKKYSIWMNGKKPCYEIPLADLQFEYTLESISNAEIRKKIRDDQLKWWRGQVKNGKAHKSEKPKWILEV